MRPGYSSPEYEPPDVTWAYRRRRLIWLAMKAAVLGAVGWLYVTTASDDYEGLARLFVVICVGLPIAILASLRWIRPRVHACPACGSPAPSPGREKLDLNALASAMSGVPRQVRGQLLAGVAFFHWSDLPIFWFFDGLVQSAVPCPNCHAWFRHPPESTDDSG